MRRLFVVLTALLALAPSVAFAAQPQPLHTAYRYKGPGWDWGAKPVSAAPVASLAAEANGAFRLRFVLAPDVNGSVRPGWRVGLVSGQPGTAPSVWLSAGRGYGRKGGASPLDGATFGGALLLRGDAKLGASGLSVNLTLDSLPQFRSAWDLYALIDTDGNPATGFLGGDMLLQDVSLGAGGPVGLDVPWFELSPGVAKPGSAVTVTAWVLNGTDKPMPRVELRLALPAGLTSEEVAGPTVTRLLPGEPRRFQWRVAARAVGTHPLRLSVVSGDRSAGRMQWLTVSPYAGPLRHYRTKDGAWLPFPERPTLQADNRAPVERLATRTSAQNRRNLFGITTHLPRSADDEDPFAVRSAIDGDPATCWASRWWRTSAPFAPEQITLDLGAARMVGAIRWMPAWRGGGAPAAFSLATSADGRAWTVMDRQTDAQAATDQTWRSWHFDGRVARYVRLSADRLRQGATGFFCAPFEPFQFRVAEFQALDGDDASIRPAAVTCSSTFHAWYNDPASIRRTWPLLFRSGVKLNRIGQWGDKIEWATVEKHKGVYRVDPEVDRAITQSVKSGVEILMTLDYGNNLYQEVKGAPDFGPTWMRGHPFLQCGPTTPEAVRGFAAYCAYMARHFRGRVKTFEIWNEENGWFFDDWAENGKVSQCRAYGRALLAAAKAMKQANPEAVVVFGGTAGMAPDFVRTALDEGAGPYVDVVAFHPYGHPTPEAAADNFLTRVGDTFEWKPRPPEQRTYEDEVRALRRLVRRYNPKMQVWADEMNWMAPGQPASTANGDDSELSQAKYLARFFAMNAWLECGAVWWSLYNANGIQEWAVVRSSDMSPRPALTASAVVSTVLDDVRPAPAATAQAVGPVPEGLMVRAFHDAAGRPIVALWRSTPASDACVPAPVSLRVRSTSRSEWEIVDALTGTRQRARSKRAPGGVAFEGLLVGDWPVFVRQAR